MLEEPKVKTYYKATPAAEVCGENGWVVGDQIVPDGFLDRRCRITAIGEQCVLAIAPDCHEAKFERFQGNDWRRVLPDPEPPDWADVIVMDLQSRGFSPRSPACFAISDLVGSRAEFNAAIQAIIDREKAKGGSIQWGRRDSDHFAVHGGRVAEVFPFCDGSGVTQWGWRVGPRLSDYTEAPSFAAAKAASEAALRSGA